jgi:DNA polymerase-3 subunit delta
MAKSKSYTSLVRELSKGKVFSVYLLCGEEDALVSRALDLISERVLESGSASDFSLTRLDAKSTSAGELDNAIRTVSLFGGRRLVILKDAQDLGAKEQKKLWMYLKDPLEASTLVLVVRGAGLNTRNPKLAKAAKAAKGFAKAISQSQGCVVDCLRPKARDLPKLAGQALSEHGLKVGQEGLYALVDAVGEDLGALWQAAEKLFLYKSGQGVVDASDVAQVVVNTRNQSVFELTDAVAEGSSLNALDGIRRLLRDGESPLSILSHLARHFRNLSKVKALVARGLNLDDVRSQLGLHPFVIKKSLQQSRRFSSTGLEAKLGLIASADLQLKGARLPDNLQLEVLVQRLCLQD